MASAVIQTPQIISIEGSTVRVKHPDISGYIRTSLTAPYTAAGITLTLRDNDSFADNDWFIIGEIGNAKTETGDVNGTVTRGTSMTITNSTKFSHEIDTSVTRIIERGVKIYGAATDGGSGTIIESIDAITAATNQLADAAMIEWDKDFTEYTILSTDTTYAFYYVTFTDGTTESSASSYVAAAGLAYNSAGALIQDGLDITRARVDGVDLTWQFLLSAFNDCQSAVSSYVQPGGTIKNWPFEINEDLTSITILQNENEYAVSGLSFTLKYPDSNQGIIQVRIGSEELFPIDLDEMERELNGKPRTEVATQAAIGATTLVVDDISEYADSGALYLGTQSALVTYTGKSEAASSFSFTGIPASGTGSITAIATVDAVVWQNISPATPKNYTQFNNNFILERPPNSDTAGKKLKVRAYMELPRITSVSDVTVIPFTHIIKYFIAASIEYNRKNKAEGDSWMSRFESELDKASRKYLGQMPDVTTTYRFSTSENNI